MKLTIIACSKSRFWCPLTQWVLGTAINISDAPGIITAEHGDEISIHGWSNDNLGFQCLYLYDIEHF